MHYAIKIISASVALLLWSQPGWAEQSLWDSIPETQTDLGQKAVHFEFTERPHKLEPLYLQQHIQRWLEEHPRAQPTQLALELQDLYLQWGYPGVRVQVAPDPVGVWQITLSEVPEQPPRICFIAITGGTPQLRFATRWNLHLHAGDDFDRERLLQDLNWIRNNYFVPLQLQLKQIEDQSVEIDLHIPVGNDWIPTGNFALNDVTGLSLTAGVIADNPLDQGNLFRAMLKRNNIPFPFYTVQNEVQDWEYTLSWATTNLPQLALKTLPWSWASPLLETGLLDSEGLSLGLNQYNKVDFIYPSFSNEPVYERSLSESPDLVWIRSLGMDLYLGLPLWIDLPQHRYLRGVANLSLLEDRFFSGSQSQLDVGTVSQSGKAADLLLMPSFSLVYSDLDDYRFLRNGNFVQARLSGSVLDANFAQGTVKTLSLWSPVQDQHQQMTFLLRSALGSTFGLEPPFYRGFLNSGDWLIRGATSYSVRDKHSIRLSEEWHYIYWPTALELEQFSDALIGNPALTALEGWSLDANLFLDQGVYWRDELAPRSAQLSAGIGINAVTPNGTILGLDFAVPLAPYSGGLSVLTRISAPLSFTFFSDWINTNGFFWR